MSKEDPILCGGGPSGEREYLERIRCPSGAQVRCDRLGSVTTTETAFLRKPGVSVDLGPRVSRRREADYVDPAELPLDAYLLVCECGRHQLEAFFDMYHRGTAYLCCRTSLRKLALRDSAPGSIWPPSSRRRSDHGGIQSVGCTVMAVDVISDRGHRGPHAARRGEERERLRRRARGSISIFNAMPAHGARSSVSMDILHPPARVAVTATGHSTSTDPLKCFQGLSGVSERPMISS